MKLAGITLSLLIAVGAFRAQSANASIPCGVSGFVPIPPAAGLYQGNDEQGHACSLRIKDGSRSKDTLEVEIDFLGTHYSDVTLKCRMNQDTDEISYKSLATDKQELWTLYPIGLSELKPNFVRLFNKNSPADLGQDCRF